MEPATPKQSKQNTDGVNEHGHKFIQHAQRRAKGKTETRRSFYNRDDSKKKAAPTITHELTEKWLSS
jgi:hypothetical protein